jgi:hypothetical protein
MIAILLITIGFIFPLQYEVIQFFGLAFAVDYHQMDALLGHYNLQSHYY